MMKSAAHHCTVESYFVLTMYQVSTCVSCLANRTTGAMPKPSFKVIHGVCDTDEIQSDAASGV